MRGKEKGQVLVGAIMLLLVLTILIPVMVVYVQNEAKWSLKEKRATDAFHLAEAAVEKGYRKVSESTTTWQNIQNGTIPAGYLAGPSDNPPQPYSDIPGGAYALSVSSGPQSQQVTIIGFGRDAIKKEVRSITEVFSNTPMGNTAIRGVSGVTISGANVQVEWGAVISPSTLNTNNLKHPQFYSAGNISPNDTNGPTPPNCDQPNCWQWFSYVTTLPSNPSVDFAFYQASATATGTYFASTQNWPGTPCGSDTTSCNTGDVYYINGDLNIASPGIYINGTLIVTGNLTLPNGRAGQGSPVVPLPQLAWMQYGNDWAFYKGNNTQSSCSVGWYDNTPPPANFPGLNSSYKSNSSITVDFSSSGKVLVNGFLYVGGNLNSAGGSGKTVIVGAAYVAGNVTLGAQNICVFNTTAASQSLKTTNVVLTRQSWTESLAQWPGGLP